MDFDDEDIFDDDMDIVNIIDFGFPRRIIERHNYFEELDNLTFFRRFRLYKETVLHILSLIEEDLEYPNDMNNSIAPINQLLVCLRFFASAGHLSALSDFGGMAISSVSRIIVRVSEALARLYQLYIKMPSTQEDIMREGNMFYRLASFPRVIGAIDCTHIKIQSPGGNDAEVFRNRKSYFSINVQAVCNAQLKIMNVVSRWPGSTHDVTIFNASNLRIQFENGHFPNSYLLGDRGYALKPYLLTPLGNPVTRAEQLYNESHIRTRNTVERLFGVWKRRFPVLAYGLRIKLDTVMNVIIATAVLHNIAIEMNEPEPPPAELLNIQELDYLIQLGQIPAEAFPPHEQLPAANPRNALINYFENL